MLASFSHHLSCIDFDTIWSCIFKKKLMFARCPSYSHTHRANLMLLMTLTVDSRVLAFRETQLLMISLSISQFFQYSYLISLRLDLASTLAPFWNHFPALSRISFWWDFGCLFDTFASKMVTKGTQSLGESSITFISFMNSWLSAHSCAASQKEHGEEDGLRTCSWLGLLREGFSWRLCERLSGMLCDCLARRKYHTSIYYMI